MKRLLLALALVAFAGLAIAGGKKITYAGKDLKGASVESLVIKYAKVTGAELPDDLNQVMIVVDGRPPAIGHVQGDAKIKTAKSVEVMGQSRSVLVNIVTR
ncbi:hypothetical protein [Pseudoxanthomonas dokdonensis]|uniref:Uncharacterized protein n=1 Tax=Pseudoxanthomonas dokdonensis TaxID=344882 RepID=A0A0R0CLV2_9GAMM|nr:hypothetical protein [Pseudoxanthomonas dokdonensis]KRG71004.1 hypothetical protein ABB29_04045 [Pseudoxanthomonas dokdonensis]